MKYKAKSSHDDNAGEWIVRLHRYGYEGEGGEYIGLCACNGPHEAELIEAAINFVIDNNADPDSTPDQAMKQIIGMFEWDWFQTKDQQAKDADDLREATNG